MSGVGPCSIATAAGGIDFDDQSAFRFPFAPEMLDGIDNNGDALTDNGPMLCPADLEPNRPGTCVLDDRMGWYEDQPAVELQMRTHMEDGSTRVTSCGVRTP